MELIVAVDKNGGIGFQGKLLYSIREDMKRFREITMHKTLLMGRATFESLPGAKPLPGRMNCVLTTRCEEMAQRYPAGEFGPFFYPCLDAFLEAHGKAEVMVIGGGEVYRQCLPLCTRAYITYIPAESPADTFFQLDEDWKCLRREICLTEDLHPEFCIFERT